MFRKDMVMSIMVLMPAAVSAWDEHVRRLVIARIDRERDGKTLNVKGDTKATWICAKA